MSWTDENSVVQPSGVGVKFWSVEVEDEGGLGQVSGPVVMMVGLPFRYCTIGGENQWPRPLYLHVSLPSSRACFVKRTMLTSRLLY